MCGSVHSEVQRGNKYRDPQYVVSVTTQLKSVPFETHRSGSVEVSSVVESAITLECHFKMGTRSHRTGCKEWLHGNRFTEQ